MTDLVRVLFVGYDGPLGCCHKRHEGEPPVKAVYSLKRPKALAYTDAPEFLHLCQECAFNLIEAISPVGVIQWS